MPACLALASASRPGNENNSSYHVASSIVGIKINGTIPYRKETIDTISYLVKEKIPTGRHRSCPTIPDGRSFRRAAGPGCERGPCRAPGSGAALRANEFGEC